MAVAAGVEVVATHGFAHEADFGEHGAAAAVGAAVGAQNDVLFGQAVFCHDFVHMVEELGQEAFGFGHGQRAGGQGDAGHAVFALFAHFVVDETVFAGDFFDFGLVAGDTPATMRFWLAVRRKSPLWILAISRRPVLSGRPGASVMRPFSMKRVRCHFLSSPCTQPMRSPRVVNS